MLSRLLAIPAAFLVRSAEEPTLLESLPKWALYLLAGGCLALAAIVAGLTLGLMSLDMVGLEILQQSAEEKDRENARRIEEIRRDGNLLLVTLLLTNTLAMETLPLVLETIFPGGILSLLLSVALVMLFGEIIPQLLICFPFLRGVILQAVCSRHALEIGSKFVDLVKVLRFLLFPVAKPISWCLDTLLGQEMGQVYTRQELKGLVDVHHRNKYGVLTDDETLIMKGALDLDSKRVEQVMTKAKDAFMLNVNEILNRDTMKKIMHYGHSRVPLYLNERSNVVGLLLIKQLLLIDPDDEMPIRAMFNKKKKTHKIRVAPPVYASKDVGLHDILNEFQNGRSHMAIVYDDIRKPAGQRQFLGIVTLEDIIEEILQEEIVDETDVFMDNRTKKPVRTRSGDGPGVRGQVSSSKFVDMVAAKRMKGTTTHIIIREIDLEQIRRPIRQMLEDEEVPTIMDVTSVPATSTTDQGRAVRSYGTFSRDPSVRTKREVSGVQTVPLQSLSESPPDPSTPVTSTSRDFLVIIPQESEEGPSLSENKSQDRKASAADVSSGIRSPIVLDLESGDNSVDPSIEDRPTTAPPRVEYDEEEDTIDSLRPPRRQGNVEPDRTSTAREI